MKQSSFSVLECPATVAWETDCLSPLIAAAFGGFAAGGSIQPAALAYRVLSEPESDCFSLFRNGEVIDRGLDSSKLLFALQQDLVVSVQRLRHDLVFVHAAPPSSVTGARFSSQRRPEAENRPYAGRCCIMAFA